MFDPSQVATPRDCLVTARFEATVRVSGLPLFATGSPVAEAYRAEQYAVDRGRAPGPRVDALEPGDVVEHTEFGIGTVLEVTGAGSQAVALVSFGAKGRRKRLLLRYAPMQKIDT
ncbi:hypothetical protein QFZ24_010076 [Streptomyces phaeochromogenes]|uniref:hypothetical protein n=1 Tax=Streptomyces phaeochromogenes TaxID=1923 RepID=UPI00278DA29A|nr:hypothetical protein [Streptomyces phaeochromogenes]MDQ0956067.1 hypothetical protein [Streptomyces phaeochromogenes]